MSNRDPGWGPALRRQLLHLFPLYTLIFMRRAMGRATGGITTMRALFLSFVLSLFLFLAVLVLITDAGAGEGRLASVILLLGCAGAVTGFVFARRRRLETTDAGALARSFNTRLFVMIAFAQTPALCGFVGTFVQGALRPYLVGMAVSVTMLLVAAPGRRNLERAQEEVRASGSDLSVIDALESQAAR